MVPRQGQKRSPAVEAGLRCRYEESGQTYQCRYEPLEVPLVALLVSLVCVPVLVLDFVV
jgi:hypothetical protein